MTGITSLSTPIERTVSLPLEQPGNEYVRGWRVAAIFVTLVVINAFSQIDRILPFILAESIKADLGLSDTQMGLLTGIAFAVCYSLLSLPLARAADRGSPRFVLVSCIVLWSAMTAFGGFAAMSVPVETDLAAAVDIEIHRLERYQGEHPGPRRLGELFKVLRRSLQPDAFRERLQ